jgi:Mn2+/Fe2+ NRAMP family transporter
MRRVVGFLVLVLVVAAAFAVVMMVPPLRKAVGLGNVVPTGVPATVAGALPGSST